MFVKITWEININTEVWWNDVSEGVGTNKNDDLHNCIHFPYYTFLG